MNPKWLFIFCFLIVTSYVKAQSTDSKLGLDISLLADYPFIVSDNAVTQAGVKNYQNGFGYNLGLGLRWKLGKIVFWRNGVHFNMKRFHSRYSVSIPGNPQPGNADEYGNLHNMGIYSAVNLEFGRFIVGAGLDFSFIQIYKGDYSIKNSSGTEIDNTKNSDISILAQQNGKNAFNMQLDANLILGTKFRLANGALNIKPILQFTAPMISMFDVQGVSGSHKGVYGFLMSFGVIFDIGFKIKLPKRSLLDD